jgi:stage II sporulation protein D
VNTLLTLTAFFLIGASIASAQNKDKEVRIGVLGLFHAKQIVVSPVAGESLRCKTGGESWAVRGPMAVELNGSMLGVASADNVPGKILSCDDGAGRSAKFVVNVPGKISRRYSGKLEITPGARELRVIVIMGLEIAVASIVAAESPPHAPLEALKAQAVATRSFLLAGKGQHQGFDFCDTTHCQFLREPPATKTAPSQAAVETSGLVLSYKSEVLAAMYSRSCGGRTHALSDLGIPVRGYPYFAVTCNYCQRHPEKWVTKIDAADATSLAPTESARLQLVRKLGWKAIPGNSYSSRTENGDVILEGVGVGHGIGLCQRGGADMARQGASFQQILEHYYPNTEVKQY